MGIMDFFKKGQEKPVQKQPEPSENRPANPAGTSPVNQPEPKTQRDYTIKSGDSLSKIAREFYGNANDWQKIYQANKDTIKDPNMIYPGQKIIIP
jgi:nucleoid-associated protein YgaU